MYGISYFRDIPEFQSCLKAINNLLNILSTELCSSKRTKDFSELCEILHLFSGVERICTEEYGSNSHSVQILRDCQCVIFQIVEELSKFWDFRTLNSNSSLVNAPVDDIAMEPEELYPVSKRTYKY
ncbi:uncharacterized protein CEXT_133082 [Caerostris extrusa]|uniref:Uncharacterized protein n=1 Tax=Caerostris extrusa TaxID=172846 RepID=A0AAV4NGR9_CAEEX|nr:uncharacterized protein CEXT_133082 [Caerostris extrusa]